MDRTVYTNPLGTRYASEEMRRLFSEENRIRLFRELWTALADCQRELGLNITKEQTDELAANILPINFGEAARREQEVRHDVMAHVYAYGLQCPTARPIIHLGATSCFVTDNADVIIYRDALAVITKKLAGVLTLLCGFAKKHKTLPALGFTHLQPAQPVTVGKRAALWAQDFLTDFDALNKLSDSLKLRGIKGATGTQASFMDLFDGDAKKVKELERLLIKRFAFKKAFTVCGQTYPRKLDYAILSSLSMLAQSAGKFAGDMRLLQHMKELEEPCEDAQVGSSAMPYKRNPMRCERITSLSRYIISLPLNAAMTASNQWLERTLDDSANRRITMAQGFLAADAVLELLLNVAGGITVNKKVISRHIKEELPFMATELILMRCVKAGGDRQLLHEAIRRHSAAASERVKGRGRPNDLVSRIKNDAAFAAVHGEIDALMSPRNFIGRAPEQVDELVAEVRRAISKYRGAVDTKDGVSL